MGSSNSSHKCFDLVMMFVIFRLVAFEQGNKALSRGLLRDNDGLSPLNKALFLLSFKSI